MRRDDDSIWDFWAQTLESGRRLSTPVIRTPVDGALRSVDIDDVTFPGFGGQPIRAWFLRSVDRAEHLPVVVEFVGYGGGRGYVCEHLLWASCGYAHFVMDVRGQGSGWRIGVTPDAGSPSVCGDSFFTRGLDSPENYYYRRFYTAAVLAADAVRDFPEVDADRVRVTGVSQGGGAALAVASLRDDLLAVMPDVPAMGAYSTALELAEEGPYVALADYLAVHREEVGQVEQLLDVFDTEVLGVRAPVPTLFSLGGRDNLVPPPSIRRVFAAYGGPKEMVEYPYNRHEGGGATHMLRQVSWLSALLVSAQ